MTEQEISEALKTLAVVGLADRTMRDGVPAYRITDAGRDYVEQVLMPGVEDREKVYALGRLQGLREAENRKPQ